MHNEESNDLSRRRTRRILRKKGKKGLLKVQKRKAKRKTRRKKILAKTVGSALLLPLLPFKKPMSKALNKKGVNTSKMKFRAVVGKFFNEFVSKSGNKKSSYDPIDEVSFYNDQAFVTPISELNLEDSDNLALTTATISTVVSGVINLFKKAKERRQAAKDSGLSKSEAKELITEQDLQFGSDAENVQRKLEEKAKEDTPVEKGKMKKFITYGLILALLATVVYFVSKKK